MPGRRGSSARSSPNSETLERTIVETTANIAREQQRIAEIEALLPALESDEQAEADAARARR